MSLDRALGIVGVVIGLPAFFALFFSDQIAIAVLAAFLGIVLIGAGVATHYLLARHAFRAKRVELALDVSPNHSTLKKSYRMVPNYNHLAQFTHRNIAADGKIHSFTWDGTSVKDEQVSQHMGEFKIVIPFTPPPPRGREFSGELAYVLDDSFLNSNEDMAYVVDLPTDEVKLAIALSKPCKTAEARVEAGGQSHEHNLTISPDRKKLEAEAKRPKVGSRIVVYWTW